MNDSTSTFFVYVTSSYSPRTNEISSLLRYFSKSFFFSYPSWFLALTLPAPPPFPSSLFPLSPTTVTVFLWLASSCPSLHSRPSFFYNTSTKATICSYGFICDYERPHIFMGFYCSPLGIIWELYNFLTWNGRQWQTVTGTLSHKFFHITLCTHSRLHGRESVLCNCMCMCTSAVCVCSHRLYMNMCLFACACVGSCLQGVFLFFYFHPLRRHPLFILSQCSAPVPWRGTPSNHSLVYGVSTHHHS